MTILTSDEIRRLVREAMDQYAPCPAVPAVAVVSVPDDDDDAFPCLSADDDELPSLALTEELVPSSIPSIPSFLEAVEDAFDSSSVADDVDDPQQFDVPAFVSVWQARPTSSCSALCSQTTPLLCAPCTPTEYTDTVEGSFGAVFSSVSWRFRDTG
jgi:hypothetical protein